MFNWSGPRWTAHVPVSSSQATVKRADWRADGGRRCGCDAAAFACAVHQSNSSVAADHTARKLSCAVAAATDVD